MRTLGQHSLMTFPQLFSQIWGVCSRGDKGLIALVLFPGRPVQDYFSLGYALSHVSSLGWLTSYLPGFLRVPKWIIALYTSKF